MRANDRFADAGIAGNHREAAVLRMNLDHVDDLRLLRQQWIIVAVKRLFGQSEGGFNHDAPQMLLAGAFLRWHTNLIRWLRPCDGHRNRPQSDQAAFGHSALEWFFPGD